MKNEQPKKPENLSEFERFQEGMRSLLTIPPEEAAKVVEAAKKEEKKHGRKPSPDKNKRG